MLRDSWEGIFYKGLCLLWELCCLCPVLLNSCAQICFPLFFGIDRFSVWERSMIIHSVTTIWFLIPEEIPHYTKRSPESHLLCPEEVLWSSFSIHGLGALAESSVTQLWGGWRFQSSLRWAGMSFSLPEMSPCSCWRIASPSVCFLPSFHLSSSLSLQMQAYDLEKSGDFMFQLIFCNTFTTIFSSTEYHQSHAEYS